MAQSSHQTLRVSHLGKNDGKSPGRVLFNIKQAIDEFDNIISRMNDTRLDLDSLMSDIVRGLQFEYFWPAEIQTLKSWYIDNADTPIERDLMFLDKAIMLLGEAVFRQLQYHGFYKDGRSHPFTYDMVDKFGNLHLTRL